MFCTCNPYVARTVSLAPQVLTLATWLRNFRLIVAWLLRGSLGRTYHGGRGWRSVQYFARTNHDFKRDRQLSKTMGLVTGWRLRGKQPVLRRFSSWNYQILAGRGGAGGDHHSRSKKGTWRTEGSWRGLLR